MSMSEASKKMFEQSGIGQSVIIIDPKNNMETVEILKANVKARRYLYKFTRGQGFATQIIPDSFIDDMRTKCVKYGAISKPVYQSLNQKHNRLSQSK